MQFTQQEIISNVSTRLLKFIEILGSIKIEPYLEMEIHSKDFRDQVSLISILKQVKNSTDPLIYIFECVNLKEKRQLIENFRLYIKSNGLVIDGQSRLTTARFNDTDSDVLYLGSVMGNFRSRIKQHLGWGHSKTYSLQLAKWDNEISYNLNVQAFRICSDKNVLERSSVELIEQALWHNFSPVFGKKSGL
jgi:hypothetical protein